MSEHDGSDDEEVSEVKERVEALMESYQLMEKSGHCELNQIRDIASTLELRWTRFHSDMEHRHKNLHLSLHFQENLFEVRIFLAVQ